jgi:cysteine desulfurase
MDNASTTAVDPRVMEAMLPYFTERFGNAASRTHRYGWEAEEAVETARARVAALIGAAPREIVFTSGATESDNLAVKGVARAQRDRGDHVVTVATEHKAVLDAAAALRRDGFRVTVLPVGGDGRVDPEVVAGAIEARTVLVAVMAANNEIGVLHPLAEVGAICHARGVPLFTDAAQAAGKVPLDVATLAVDLVALSAHKMYGPKGIGALYVRRRDPRVQLQPLVDGGGHERGLRSGTLNVPAIVGFGVACDLAAATLTDEAARLKALRDRLLARLAADLDGVRVNGSLEHRLPGNLNVTFEGVEGDSLLVLVCDHVAVSSGSACTSASPEPSYVLKALGVPPALAQASLRFGLGRFTTADEVERAADAVAAAARRLRAMSVAAPRRRD